MAFLIDDSTLTRASGGEPEALTRLAAALKPHIEKQLLRYPVTDEDRRDLVQATLMQVIRRLSSFRGDASFSTWLFRVTANEALMLMRSQRRHRARVLGGLNLEELGNLPAANDKPHEHEGTATAAANERDARVRQALEELPFELPRRRRTSLQPRPRPARDCGAAFDHGERGALPPASCSFAAARNPRARPAERRDCRLTRG